MKFLGTRAADSVEASKYDHSRHAQVISPALVRLPIHFFTIGVLSLACVGLAAVAVMPVAVPIFLSSQEGLGAGPHFDPGSHHGGDDGRHVSLHSGFGPQVNIAFSRLAYPQLLLFVAGVVGMVAHFAIGNWVGLWWSAVAVLLSVGLFALCLLPILWPRLGRGIAETGMFLSICYLLCAAVLGLAMGLAETYGFAWGNLPRMLGAHVVFAAIGWVTLTICAASYRFIPCVPAPDGETTLCGLVADRRLGDLGCRSGADLAFRRRRSGTVGDGTRAFADSLPFCVASPDTFPAHEESIGECSSMLRPEQHGWSLRSFSELRSRGGAAGQRMVRIWPARSASPECLDG